MSKIIVVGSLNIDIVLNVKKMPKVGETVIGNNLTYLVGGKGANQAVCCSRLSNHVTLLGMVGKDAFGEKLIDKMKLENINVEHIEMNELTCSGVAVITKSSEDNSIVVIPGANDLITSNHVQAKENLIAESDILISQLEVPLKTVKAAMELAKNNGVLTILNPAPFQPLDNELLSYVDYITPNETEFLEMGANMFVNSDISLEKAMVLWQNEHSTRLVVTLGSQGCAYVENGRVIKIPTYKANVVDTTGAGDTFNGALAHCLAKKIDLHSALKLAVKAGSLSVEKFGAQTGMPTLEELMSEEIIS